MNEEEIFSAREEEFTVIVKILGAKQLSGLDVDPSVRVQIAEQEKCTKKKKSTNDPIFDEVNCIFVMLRRISNPHCVILNSKKYSTEISFYERDNTLAFHLRVQAVARCLLRPVIDNRGEQLSSTFS